MKKLCILQYPDKITLSYKVYNEYFKILGCDCEYESISFESKYFSIKIKNILNNYYGFNLTNPFKQTIKKFVKADSVVDKIGSANCVFEKIAYNTDWIGVYKSIDMNSLKEPVLIIGAGGVARSIIYTLSKIGIKNIFVSNRTYDKALKLKDSFEKVNIVDFKSLNDKINDFKTLMNATTVGLNNDAFYFIENIKSISYIYDVIYHQTPLQLLAKKRNINFTSGEKMWYYQAIENLKIWKLYNKKTFYEVFKTLGGSNENCFNAAKSGYRRYKE